MSIKLFTPYTIKNITLKNRIVMAPMCMYSSTEEGYVENWHYTHYTSRAVGQTGLLLIEATAVTPQGRISEKDLGIWSDDHIEPLKKLTSMIKEHGAKAGIQLGHAGRKATVKEAIIAPSSLPFNEQYKTPVEMSTDQIHATIEAFKLAAERANKAGFDVIELHAAHGYLINQFLSPLTNKRTDEYGGTKENRYRFLKEIIDQVNEVWQGPLFVRISAEDYHPDGLTVEDYFTLSLWMKEQGVDFIDVSSGAVVPAHIDVYPGYQVPLAEKIKHHAHIDTGAVGLITSPVQAEEILQNERADLIFLARVLLREPYWPKHAAKELGFELDSPTPYARGWNI
ncbi:MAG: NADPH dehydrogenase NamA [Bacillus sp. (in: firmicutes)]